MSIFGESFTVYSNVGLQGITLGRPEQIGEGEYKIPLAYNDDYQCSILYLAADSEGNSDEDDAERASKILFEPLPEGRKY